MVAGNYLTARDVEQTVIRQDPGGAHLRVRDIARVTPGFEERDLAHGLGEMYHRYRDSTPMIIPWPVACSAAVARRWPATS